MALNYIEDLALNVIQNNITDTTSPTVQIGFAYLVFDTAVGFRLVEPVRAFNTVSDSNSVTYLMDLNNKGTNLDGVSDVVSATVVLENDIARKITGTIPLGQNVVKIGNNFYGIQNYISQNTVSLTRSDNPPVASTFTEADPTVITTTEAHGLAIGDQVRFKSLHATTAQNYPSGNESINSGIAPNKSYYVSLTPSTTTFSVSCNEPYTGLTVTGGTGSGAAFSVQKGNSVYHVGLVSGGGSYTAADTLTITGDQLDGATTANDLTITVDTVDSGIITAFSVSGTPSSTNPGLIEVTAAGTAVLQVLKVQELKTLLYDIDPINDNIVGKITKVGDGSTNTYSLEPYFDIKDINDRIDASANTTGTLDVADANTAIIATGDITVPSGEFAPRDSILVMAGSSSREITRGSGLAMYLSGSDVATATLSANGIMSIVFESASKCYITGDVS